MSASQVCAGVGENQQSLAQYAQIWETLAIQLHNLNDASIVAMTGNLFRSLDHAGRRYMQDRMRVATESMQAFFVRDGMHPDRWLLGNYADLQSVPGSAIYVVNGLPTLTLNGPHCPYPDPVTQSIASRPMMKVDMAMVSQVTTPSSPDTPSDSHTDGATHSSTTGNAQDTDHEVPVVKVPRPPNAYILYRKDKHREIENEHPGIRNNEISVLAGSMWNTETTAVREHYAAIAEAMKVAHKVKYPDYKYAPRRPDQVKRRAKRNPAKAIKTKNVTGTITQPRKIIIGELQQRHFRKLNDEVAQSNGLTASESGPDLGTHREQLINVGISAFTEQQAQRDIDEWNACVPEHIPFDFNTIEADISDFLNTDQFESGNECAMDQGEF